ncbi:4-hydroxybenzoate polyprenyl transferase family protein (macronuclear) [Tetrahymena thermophila SB210]|uniref:4-hydroxybenzoate polyprenyl transferase family protein n=1 Tax=Tetrahymena thermophila (strain SB210) TaxID=312017 RepID=Q23B09_TETTS|nr:4-hydroxybenzoate polyprenyl transferase family protein [Tetrahymena thermophila SB210]EAR93675.2 4-hydroxybenzoate polyprenyl transferase family protein [Tetrahymena thermophila SB210]|eukprot:XP_001013920.2 4-hydroxybenzoate polyprenyl transferase family protein [Tetrahymena thermophila SB210]
MSQPEQEELDQLFHGEPIVISQQLFEQTNHLKIANILKDIQKEIVKKNNTLKSIFSHNYVELLNCSDLLININEYSKNISKLSEKPAKSLQKIFDLNMSAATLAKDGSVSHSDTVIKQDKDLPQQNLKNISDSIDILISKTSKIYQKYKLFSIAARQSLSLKSLLKEIKQSLSQQLPNSKDIYLRYFGDKEMLINEICSEIFEQGIRYILQQNEEVSQIDQNEELEQMKQETRIWIYIDQVIAMCLLLQALRSQKDVNIFLSSIPSLNEFSYQPQYIFSQNNNQNIKTNQEQLIQLCLKESFNIIQEIKLKNLEKSANIAKFMNYFSDFYALVKYFNDQPFYSGFITLFEELNAGVCECSYLTYFTTFKSVQDIKDYQQSILPSDDSYNLKYQSDVLSIIQNIYNLQFNQLSTIIRAMLIHADEEDNKFFNHTFFQRMMFEEKNIKMIEHIKNVLDQIYQSNQNTKQQQQQHKDLKTILYTVWEDFYCEEIKKSILGIQIEDMIVNFKKQILEKTGQNIEYTKYGDIKYQEHLQNEYEQAKLKIQRFSNKLQIIFGFEEKHDSAYNLEIMRNYLYENVNLLVENYENSLVQMWEEQESNPSFDLMKVFIIFLFFHNYLVEQLLSSKIREGAYIEWDVEKFNEIQIYIQDRIQFISDEIIKKLSEEHYMLSYQEYFMIYLYELDEFLHNFIENGDVKQLEICKQIVLSIFQALENEENGSIIKNLTNPSRLSQYDNMKFINITYILGSKFSLQPREYFEKEQEKETIAQISKIRKEFKEKLIPINQKQQNFLLFQEQLVFIQSDNRGQKPQQIPAQKTGVSNSNLGSQNNLQTNSDTNKQKISQKDPQIQQPQQTQSVINAQLQQTAKNLVGEVSNKFKELGFKETATSLLSKLTKN